MKKLLLAAIMLFSVGQTFGGLTFCLRNAYEHNPNILPVRASGAKPMARPYHESIPVKAYGPGTSRYEQYKNCMQENGKKPAPVIYASDYTDQNMMG